MPLLDMSANIQMPEAASRKRSHDEYADQSALMPVGKDAPDTGLENIAASPTKDTPLSAVEASATHIPDVTVTEVNSVSSPLSSPRSSSPAVLTDAASSTPPQPSPSPNQKPAMTQSTSTPLQAVPSNPISTAASTIKRKRKTPAEKQQEEAAKRQKKDEEAAKRQKKEEEAAEKEKLRLAEKAAKAAEKEAKAAEKAAKTAEREAKAAEKAAEKAKVEREKEEKRLQKQKEEEKKKRSQPTLFTFIKKPPQEDNEDEATDATKSDAVKTAPVQPPVVVKEQPKPEKTPYERLFRDFYLKDGVTVAPLSLMSSDAQEAKSRILEEYIFGKRDAVDTKPFDPVATFQLIGRQPPRGTHYPSVKKIMADILEEPMDPNTHTESQHARVANAQAQLDKIPVKILSFYHDVRPPYVGTVTSSTPRDLRRLSRRPNGKIIQRLNYDYDSEAEWEEEEGEDLDDLDDDDEENEADEEMADFLDDAEDVTVRPAYLPEVEPKSTGICFENRKREGPSPSVYKFRMEVLLDTAPHHGINPFSTEYWQPKITKPETATAVPVRASPFDKAVPATNAMAPPPAPNTISPKDMVPASELEDFKRAVISDDISMLTKLALVDMLSKRFKSCTKAQVKTTLEIIAHRVPTANGKKSDKHWALLPEHELRK